MPKLWCFEWSHIKKKWQKAKYLKACFWEAIQAMWVKFLWDTYDHLGYPHTKSHPILRGSCAKPWWTDMELPLSHWSEISFKSLKSTESHEILTKSHAVFKPGLRQPVAGFLELLLSMNVCMHVCLHACVCACVCVCVCVCVPQVCEQLVAWCGVI